MMIVDQVKDGREPARSGARTAILVAGEQRAILRMRSLSVRGVSGHADVAVDLGQRVTVHFRGGSRADGTVKFAAHGRVAVEFDAFIPMDIVDGEAAVGQKRRRSARGRLSRDVTLGVNDCSLPAIVKDISRGGIQIEVDTPLIPGQQVTILFDGSVPLYGQVRWVRDGNAGLMFAIPIELGRLDRRAALDETAAEA